MKALGSAQKGWSVDNINKNKKLTNSTSNKYGLGVKGGEAGKLNWRDGYYGGPISEPGLRDDLGRYCWGSGTASIVEVEEIEL